jgi:hypothetical protein
MAGDGSDMIVEQQFEAVVRAGLFRDRQHALEEAMQTLFAARPQLHGKGDILHFGLEETGTRVADKPVNVSMASGRCSQISEHSCGQLELLDNLILRNDRFQYDRDLRGNQVGDLAKCLHCRE